MARLKIKSLCFILPIETFNKCNFGISITCEFLTETTDLNIVYTRVSNEPPPDYITKPFVIFSTKSIYT